MRFDFAADPWATAMVAAAALWLMSLMAVISAFVAGASRRTGGRIMLVALVAFLGTAVGGTWERINKGGTTAPPSDPTVSETKTPPEADGGAADDAAAAAGTTGDPGPATTGDDGAGATQTDGEPTAGTGMGSDGTDGSGSDGTDGTDGSGSGGADEGSTGDDGGSTGAEPTDVPEPPDPEITKIPERVVPPNLPQVDPLPADPKAQAAAIREIVQEAEKAAGGGTRCGKLERVAEAWAKLLQIPADKKAKEIASDLETCRRKLLYSVSRRHRADQVAARDAFAKKLRDRMRTEHGLMVQVSISGKSHERLRMGNPEFDATRADAMMDEWLRAELMDLQFAHVVISDGTKARTYEFEVTPEGELGLPDLRAVGLGEPLVLSE